MMRAAFSVLCVGLVAAHGGRGAHQDAIAGDRGPLPMEDLEPNKCSAEGKCAAQHLHLLQQQKILQIGAAEKAMAQKKGEVEDEDRVDDEGAMEAMADKSATWRDPMNSCDEGRSPRCSVEQAAAVAGGWNIIQRPIEDGFEDPPFLTESFCHGVNNYCCSQAQNQRVNNPEWYCKADSKCRWAGSKKDDQIRRRGHVMCCDSKNQRRRRESRRRCIDGRECETQAKYVPREGCHCGDDGTPTDLQICDKGRRGTYVRPLPGHTPSDGHSKFLLHQEEVKAEKADAEKMNAEKASAMMEMEMADNHPRAEKSPAEEKSQDEDEDEDEDEDGVDDEEKKADNDRD